MPPGYNKLQIPQALTAPPPGVFNQEATPWEAEEAKQAALLAQQLNNQSVGISVKQRQQAYDDDQAERAAVRQEFGNGQPVPEEDQVLSVLERLALQRGDANTVMEIQRVKNANAGLRIRQQSADTYADQVYDPLLAENRRLNSILKNQQATGTQVRPVPYAAAQKFGAGDAFQEQADNMLETYMPYVSANRGVRFLTKAINTNSAEFRIQNELNLLAKQAALSLEDRVTDQDYKTIQDLTLINERDTNETVLNKVQRLKEFIQRRNEADLNAMEASNFNVSGLRNRNKSPDELAQSLSGPPEGVFVPNGRQFLGVDPATGLAIVKK